MLSLDTRLSRLGRSVDSHAVVQSCELIVFGFVVCALHSFASLRDGCFVLLCALSLALGSRSGIQRRRHFGLVLALSLRRQ